MLLGEEREGEEEGGEGEAHSFRDYYGWRGVGGCGGKVPTWYCAMSPQKLPPHGPRVTRPPVQEPNCAVYQLIPSLPFLCSTQMGSPSRAVLKSSCDGGTIAVPRQALIGHPRLNQQPPSTAEPVDLLQHYWPVDRDG
jgi:hypothetical protein